MRNKQEQQLQTALSLSKTVNGRWC